ncbi:MAG: VIT and VWA domain-containing protein [Candidatus Omnitrophica bacterium]|nr:VIT and VWA domain-containing protein [Candidatus Omnitrophota bacterium]
MFEYRSMVSRNSIKEGGVNDKKKRGRECFFTLIVAWSTIVRSINWRCKMIKRKKGIGKMVIMTLITLSVYVIPGYCAGLLKPKDSSLPDLQIKDHKVKVIVEDGYAITQIEQIFVNPTDQDMEAVYSFPVPQKASVSNFVMWIDSKPIAGEVLEKEEAKEIYEQQKANNKNVGLTEKNGYKTFEVSVYPVLAGNETRIMLEYMQPVDVDTNMASYVYPLEEGGVDDEALMFWTTNDKVTGTFSFDMTLRSSYPIDSIRLPAHPSAEIKQEGENWIIHIDNYENEFKSQQANGQDLTINNYNEEDKITQEQLSETLEVDKSFRLDRDVVVYYRLADNLPGTVDLVAYKKEGAKRGTFMLTVTPGIDLKPIIEGQDFIFVLDISGSMQYKYATLAEGVTRALKQMNPNDRFRLIVFNTGAKELTNGYIEVNQANVEKYINVLNSINPNNGTNLYAGLDLGLKKAEADRTTSIILVTDGVANVGVTEQKEFIQLIKKYDIRLFTFVMGNSTNRPLLKTMTDASEGFAISVSNDDDIIGKIMLAQSKVAFEALHGVDVKILGVKTSDITPEKIGSLYRGQQLVLFGHYFGSGEAEIVMKTRISGEEKIYKTSFDFPEVSETNPEIERLWAYASIEHLQREINNFGETPDMKQIIVDLGKKYSIVTDYTSMVIVEEEVFNDLGIDRKNKRRTELENTARKSRLSNPIVKRRVDANRPMFTNNRPGITGGAGAMDPVSALILSPLVFGWLPKKRKGDKR